MWRTIAGLAGLGPRLPQGRDGRDLSAAILKNDPQHVTAREQTFSRRIFLRNTGTATLTF